MDTTPLVYPRSSIEPAQTTDPSNMYGLRLPKRDFEWSAMTPAQNPFRDGLVHTVSLLAYQRLHDQTRQWASQKCYGCQ